MPLPQLPEGNPHDTPTAIGAPMRAEELERIASELNYSKRVQRLVGEVRRCWTEIASLKAQVAEAARNRAMNVREESGQH